MQQFSAMTLGDIYAAVRDTQRILVDVQNDWRDQYTDDLMSDLGDVWRALESYQESKSFTDYRRVLEAFCNYSHVTSGLKRK